MKNITFSLAIAFGLLPLLSWSQPRAMEERVEALRIAFFTEKLQLSPEESQDFWPLFNEFNRKERAIRKTYKSNKSLELMSDAEAEALIDNLFIMEEEMLQLKKEYFGKMRAVLPVRKLAMLPHIDRQFKERLLREMRNRQQRPQGDTPRRRNK